MTTIDVTKSKAMETFLYTKFPNQNIRVMLEQFMVEYMKDRCYNVIIVEDGQPNDNDIV